MKYNYLFYLFYFFFQIQTLFSRYNSKVIFIRKFLSTQQLSLIDKILMNTKTSLEMKNKVWNVLYIYYDQFAFTKAYQFKNFHKYKCQHISTLELYSYASIGLYNSIKKYNPKYKYSFVKYANYFIQGELLKAMTNLHPITSISKVNRRKGYRERQAEIEVNTKKSRVQLLGKNDWILDKINKDKIKENEPYCLALETFYYENLWEKINNLSSFQKRIFYYKYNFFFEKIRSNKEISKIMSCSEEWVRVNIKNGLIEVNLLNDVKNKVV